MKYDFYITADLKKCVQPIRDHQIMVRNDVIMTSSPLGAPFIKVLYLITLADEHMDLRIYILEFSKNIYGA